MLDEHERLQQQTLDRANFTGGEELAVHGAGIVLALGFGELDEERGCDGERFFGVRETLDEERKVFLQLVADDGGALFWSRAFLLVHFLGRRGRYGGGPKVNFWKPRESARDP
jgi:hypothetical protein